MEEVKEQIKASVSKAQGLCFQLHTLGTLIMATGETGYPDIWNTDGPGFSNTPEAVGELVQNLAQQICHAVDEVEVSIKEE